MTTPQQTGLRATLQSDLTEAMRARGHDVRLVKTIGGGMNAIGFAPDGTMTGAACWRADGTAIGIGGGLARDGVRFWPDRPVPVA